MKSKEQDLAIAEDYKTLTMAQIKEKYKIGYDTIYRALARCGVEKKGELGKGTWRQHSEETKNKQSESAKKVWDDRKNKQQE